MKRKSIVYTLALTFMLGGFSACEDMLDVSSSSVQYEGTHEINSAADSLYSVIGIMSKLQSIADRTILLGELRGDLVVDNENTVNDLRQLINHNVTPDNQFCDYSDYYAIINNCNYFLDKVDTNVVVSGQKVLVKEKAAVLAIRAWTYMQLALIYESVPFITKPILTVVDAEKDFPMYNLQDMCDYFIPELLPFVDTKLPSYGNIDGMESRYMFFPIRLLLGDMYLWKQDYWNAFRQYAEYTYEEGLGTIGVGTKVYDINPTTNDVGSISWSTSTMENITFIRMAASKLNGVTSNLPNIFSPTDVNEGKRAVSPSYMWKELSENQDYAYKPETAGAKVRYLPCGDLRAYQTYNEEWTDGSFNPSIGGNEEAWYLVDVENKYLINSKYDGTFRNVPIYRVGSVYLRMAEALNCSGFPTEAFRILKNGVNYFRTTATGFSVNYPANESDGIAGIHSRGSGNSYDSDRYKLSVADLADADTIHRVMTYQNIEGMDSLVKDTTVYYSVKYADDLVLLDSTFRTHKIYGDPDTLYYVYAPVEYLMEQVEEKIVDEMALETAFEGQRFYDLMRVAIRHNDPTYLAEKIAHRGGMNAPKDEALYNRLLNTNNWYIRKE